MTEQARARNTAKDVLASLRQIEQAYPDQGLHVILDNVSTHKTPAVRAWLARHPRIAFHFIPTFASWLNQVETRLSVLTRRAIHRGSFGSVKELVAMIDTFAANRNAGSSPFMWAKTADEILAKTVPQGSGDQRIATLERASRHPLCVTAAHIWGKLPWPTLGRLLDLIGSAPRAPGRAQHVRGSESRTRAILDAAVFSAAAQPRFSRRRQPDVMDATRLADLRRLSGSIDPGCGASLHASATASVTLTGTRYLFCSQSCFAAFLHSPHRHVGWEESDVLPRGFIAHRWAPNGPIALADAGPRLRGDGRKRGSSRYRVRADRRGRHRDFGIERPVAVNDVSDSAPRLLAAGVAAGRDLAAVSLAGAALPAPARC